MMLYYMCKNEFEVETMIGNPTIVPRDSMWRVDVEDKEDMFLIKGKGKCVLAKRIGVISFPIYHDYIWLNEEGINNNFMLVNI